MKKNTNSLVMNAILAAMYVVVTAVIAPFGFTNVQFRVSELFNHLVVFNKKYFYGIALGVFIANLLFSPMKAYDLTLGVGHTILSLLITMFICKYVKNLYAKLVINALVFTGMSWIIALELKLAFEAPFWFTYLTVGLGELVVLLVAIPLVIALNKKIDFKTFIK